MTGNLYWYENTKYQWNLSNIAMLKIKIYEGFKTRYNRGINSRLKWYRHDLELIEKNTKWDRIKKQFTDMLTTIIYCIMKRNNWSITARIYVYPKDLLKDLACFLSLSFDWKVFLSELQGESNQIILLEDQMRSEKFATRGIRHEQDSFKIRNKTKITHIHTCIHTHTHTHTHTCVCVCVYT